MEWIGIIFVLILAMLLNGFIAEVEDNSPGGFNNPDGNWIDVFKKPKLHQVIIWIVTVLVLLSLFLMYITKDRI